MRKYTDQNKEVLSEVICNICGRKLRVEKGILQEGALRIEKDWGFFSRKDGEVHSLDICEECYDEIVKRMTVPVEMIQKTEILS